MIHDLNAAITVIKTKDLLGAIFFPLFTMLPQRANQGCYSADCVLIFGYFYKVQGRYLGLKSTFKKV